MPSRADLLFKSGGWNESRSVGRDIGGTSKTSQEKQGDGLFEAMESGVLSQRGPSKSSLGSSCQDASAQRRNTFASRWQGSEAKVQRD
jgi:hypothetical protein